LDESPDILSTQKALKVYLKRCHTCKRNVILRRISKPISEARSERLTRFTKSSTYMDLTKFTAAFKIKYIKKIIEAGIEEMNHPHSRIIIVCRESLRNS